MVPAGPLAGWRPSEPLEGRAAGLVTFLFVLQFLVAIALTVVIILQPSKGEGLGSIGGGARMFFRKAKGWELLLERATVILAVVFMTISVALVLVR